MCIRDSYLTDGTTPTDDYFSVEVSTVNSNDNNNWEEIDKITSDVPNGSNFTEKTYDLSAYLNVQTLRIRLRYHADGWYDGVAVDDIELYGERPLQPTFTYSSFSPIGIFKDALGNIPVSYTHLDVYKRQG